MTLSHKIITAAVSATLLSVTGCANLKNNQEQGAAIGAVVGALIGKGTGDHDKSRYLWGAAVGALAGAAIGNYMDEQEALLRRELADSGVDIVRNGDQINLLLPGNITFNTGSAAIEPEFYPVLQDVALVLNKYHKTTLNIAGHTDNIGSAELNQSLSEARANSVKDQLIKYHVDNRRLTTSGFGEFKPLVANTSAENRQKNRRVELQILPNTEQQTGSHKHRGNYTKRYARF